MHIKKKIQQKFPLIYSLLGKIRSSIVNDDFWKSYTVSPEISQRYLSHYYSYNGELIKLALSSNQSLHKWAHYFPVYEQWLSKYKNSSVKLLEIGVNNGGSLELWRKFLGDKAIIYGLDINKECIKYDRINGNVRIGSQADTNFLKSIVDEVGSFDIIIDDGSHQMSHIKRSFRFLFNHLSPGGIYCVEDLHCAYRYKYTSFFGLSPNFHDYLSYLTHNMHSHYSNFVHRFANNWLDKIYFRKRVPNVESIHIHDSITIVLKQKDDYRSLNSFF